MARHPDFEKIHATFLQHYSKDPQVGEKRYQQWVKDSSLDETRGYYEQGVERAQNKQSFAWADFLIQFVKEDKEAKYYKVEALFPVESMNKDSPPFTRDEVLQSARTLTGKPSDLNHDHSQMLEGVEVKAAQFEDDCVECLVRVLKNSPLNGMIERKEIVSVSIEGEWSHGLPGQGLVLTGLGWLTKKTTLPGIPLTRIIPVERIVESFEVKAQVLECFKSAHGGKVKLEAQQDDARPACAVCGKPADFLVSICQTCLDKAGGASAQAQSNEGENVSKEELKKIVEDGVKEGLQKADGNLEVLKTKLSEAEGKAKDAEDKLKEANKTIEQLKQLVPGVDLLKNPSKLMPINDAVKLFEQVLPSPMVQRSWGLGPQRMCQDLQRAVQQLKHSAGDQ